MWTISYVPPAINPDRAIATLKSFVIINSINATIKPTNKFWIGIILFDNLGFFFEIIPKTNVTNNDLIMTAKIALAHLNEFPNYYNKDYGLPALEKTLQEKLKNNYRKIPSWK